MEPASLILFALPVLLLIFMFSSQRKRQRQFQALQGGLAPGQEILTTSGLYARIVELDAAVVVLETGPGQQLRWDRRAIASVVDAGTAASTPPATPDTPDVADRPTDERA